MSEPVCAGISYDFTYLPRWRFRLYAWVSIHLAWLLGARIKATQQDFDHG